MTTHFGVCPSYASWLSRLPIFADPIRRGKIFEVFSEDNLPTGDPSPIDPDGWPVQDGRWHGVRLFGDMDGFLPDLHPEKWPASMRLRINPGKSAWVSWRGGKPDPYPHLKPAFGNWHIPSGEAIQYFKPKVLRTLDWGWQAKQAKRPDFSRKRRRPSYPLHGECMAIELKCEAANLLNCTLWWNVPPRFELSVQEYEARVGEMLAVLKANCKKPPILEYGNELWNDGFPVHQWLKGLLPGLSWHDAAALEITKMADLAETAFGAGGPLGEKSHYIFVGGHMALPDTLDKILNAMPFSPDAAGPAFYSTPLKVDKDRWQQTGEIPTEGQLMDSLLSNLPGLRLKLDIHRNILKAHNVPYFCVYEAGQSLIANGRPWKKAALAVQRSERMAELYRALRAHLQAAMVDLACWYACASSQSPSDSRVDVFGLLESTLDMAAPLPKAVAARGN